MMTTSSIAVTAPATANAGDTVRATVSGFNGTAAAVGVRVLFNGQVLRATVVAEDNEVRVKVKVPASAGYGSLIITAADSNATASSVTFV